MENIKNSDVGKRIKILRTKKGLTMEEFGELFEPTASKSIVSRWEKGQSIPNNERLKRIAELGNLTVEYLLYGSLEEYTNNLLDDFVEELKASNTINNGVIPFIIREFESRLSQKNIFAPKDIESIDRIFKDLKNDTLEKWSNLENIENQILNFLSEDIGNFIEDYKKYLYDDYYKNDTHEISTGEKISDLSDLKMKFLDRLNKFQSAAFDDLRYGEEHITKLIEDIDEMIEKRSTIYL